MTPPQSPGFLWPAGCADVKTIGRSAVPLAMIFAPFSTMSAALVALSPLITVPASIVRVAPAVT